MKKLNSLLSLLLFTQVLSAYTLSTPKIIKIENHAGYSSTASVYYKDIYDKDTRFRIFNRGQNIGTVETQGNPHGKGRISFFTRKDTDYSIQIQAVKGNSTSGLSQAVAFTSRLKFEFTAGRDRTSIKGLPIILNGIVTKGDKSEIDSYRWEENGKILKNAEGDDIVYTDEQYQKQTYKPSKVGNHVLNFIIKDREGKEYKRSFVLRVINATAIPLNRIYLDTQGIGSNHTLTMKLGEVISLSGRVIGNEYKQLVDAYHWEKDGKVLKDTLNKEIIYWDEENRKHNYKPTKVGTEHLKFVITDIYGAKVKKELTLEIKNINLNDDHGNTRKEATNIVVNRTFHGKKDYSNDHDFFRFTLRRRQYVRINIKYANRSKRAVLYKSNLDVIRSHRSVPGSDIYRPINILLEAGTYYVDAFIYGGEYTLKVEAENIAPKDKYGDTKKTAHRISLNTTINSYINTTNDVDYFYFVPRSNGVITLRKRSGLVNMSRLNEVDSYQSIQRVHVQRNRRYYFYIQTDFASEGQQAYRIELSFRRDFFILRNSKSLIENPTP